MPRNFYLKRLQQQGDHGDQPARKNAGDTKQHQHAAHICDRRPRPPLAKPFGFGYAAGIVHRADQRQIERPGAGCFRPASVGWRLL